MVNTTVELNASKNIAPPTNETRQGSSQLGKDEFLKLLVAQLANQDPTKPQDSSQFVAQLAQFSSLEQQQNTVSRLDTLLMGQVTANQTSASAFIGKDVSFLGGTVHLDGVNAVKATVTLAAPAAKSSVLVSDNAGNVVRTIDVGANAAGDVSVSWDGRGDSGAQLPAGDYHLSARASDADDQAVPISVSSSGTVSGVSFQGGVSMLKVGTTLIKMSDVTSINERNTP